MVLASITGLPAILTKQTLFSILSACHQVKPKTLITTITKLNKFVFA